jgi:putative transposase
MARRLRRVIPGELYHVVNRGNDKRVIFREDADYEHFTRLLIRGRERADVTIHGFSLLSTHFHLLVRPMRGDALSSFMHWVTGCYACELRKNTATVGFGHVFQRRFFSAAVEDHLGGLTVLGYIEANAREAGVVRRAEEWRWCSLFDRSNPRSGLATYDALRLPANWIEMVNLPWTDFLIALVEHDLAERRNRRMGRS